LGDLPNLEVNADGTATKTVVAARLSLADVANRALMIHASQDDNSARMACGRLN
jgi:Cu/Zn superoxide dismutase